MIKRLWPYLKARWFRFSAALICMVAAAGINTALMWMLKFLIDSAMLQKDMDALKAGVALIITGFSLKAIFWYANTYLTSYVGQSIARQIRDDVFRHLTTLSMGFFNQKTSANLMARLTNDVTVLQSTLRSTPTVLIREGLTAVGLIGFIFYLNWKFALLCFSILPIASYVLLTLGIKSRVAGREGQSRMATLYDTIQEAILSMPIVKSFQNEKKEIAEFEKENQNYFNVMMKLVRVEARSSPIMEVLGAVLLSVMVGIGGAQVINGTWSLGGFVAFIGAAMSLYKPIKQFANLNVQAQQGLAAAERVFQLLDQKPTVFDSPNAEDAKPFQNAIRFENVSFSYPDSPQVIDGIELHLKKGEAVALVGPSGSGKSTMAQMLLRFYDPTAGRLTFDGRDFRDLTVSSIRKQIGIVTQETHLFNDTIVSNIEYGRPGASKDEIENAAKAAYAHDFIVQFPKGYDSVVGEKGARLSGGERQRLAIARALLKNPPILILDEATSALDAESEQMVQKALDRLLDGRTVLMIAHRLSTVRKADRIIVLENGKIKESGRHEDLVKIDGVYRKLYDMQSLAF